MGRSMVKIVPVTASHVLALYGKSLPSTIYGFAGLDDGKLFAIGASYTESGTTLITCRIAEDARADLRRYTRAILTATRALLAQAARARLPVRAIADSRYPRSVALLEHLGFRNIEKDMFEWTTST